MNPIIIDAEFRALIPPLSADERAGLEADIITAGRAIKPLDTWRGILLDGYNRHEICTRLGLPFTTEEVAGIDDREYALLWIERNQLHRRNLPDDQRAAIAFRVGQRVSALAMKERALAANETRWRRQPEVSLSVDVSDKDDTPEPSPPATPKPKRDTRKEVARQAKVSERKVRAIAEIYKKDPEALDRLARGETLIFEERAKQNAEARAAIAFAKPVIPTGRYSCIVIDPPWPMERFARELAPNQVGFDYPTMTEEELTAFPVPAMAEDDCHLFTWTTHRFFPMAQRLIERWGFKYVCIFVWHKPGGFQVIGLPQYNCEFAIYARRGSPKFIDLKQFFCCFSAGRREHSRKPDEFYDVVRRVTAEPRIDVFSRESRDGFEQYGNEVGKFADDQDEVAA